jgi:hypothetical protein
LMLIITLTYVFIIDAFIISRFLMPLMLALFAFSFADIYWYCRHVFHLRHTLLPPFHIDMILPPHSMNRGWYWHIFVITLPLATLFSLFRHCFLIFHFIFTFSFHIISKILPAFLRWHYFRRQAIFFSLLFSPLI